MTSNRSLVRVVVEHIPDVVYAGSPAACQDALLQLLSAVYAISGVDFMRKVLALTLQFSDQPLEIHIVAIARELKLKKYLDSHPTATVASVIRAAAVDASDFRRWRKGVKKHGTTVSTRIEAVLGED